MNVLRLSYNVLTIIARHKSLTCDYLAKSSASMSHAGVTANVAIFKIATSISTIRANFEMGRKSDSSVSVIGALGGSGHLFFN